MVKNWLFILFFLFYALRTESQNIPKNNTVREDNFFYFGTALGISRSVVFLSRNIIEYNDAHGIYMQLSLNRAKKLLRYEISFNSYNKIQIDPTWKDVKSWIFEQNVNILARFVNVNGIIFPTAGWCVSNYRGIFTGISDVQGLRSRFAPGTMVNQYWWGLTFGVGAERFFFPFSLGGYYKMRVSNGDLVDRINIVDVCFTAFIKYYFTSYFSKKYLGPRGRYILRTVD